MVMMTMVAVLLIQTCSDSPGCPLGCECLSSMMRGMPYAPGCMSEIKPGGALLSRLMNQPSRRCNAWQQRGAKHTAHTVTSHNQDHSHKSQPRTQSQVTIKNTVTSHIQAHSRNSQSKHHSQDSQSKFS
jgi:hypothetical protein